MPDEFSFSYSFQTSGPTPAGQTESAGSPGVDQMLYAVADIERVDLGNGGVLLFDRKSDAQMIVSPEVSVALHSCRTFRSLAEHADFLANSIPQLSGQQADVVKVLQSVRDAGLLTTATSVCQRLCPADLPAADLERTRVFIITCDRPRAVQRLLESMLSVSQLTQHEHLFLVDDSRDRGNAELNREAVQQFNIKSPRDMHYVGADEQLRLMSALVSELPDCEQGIRFLIDREKWRDKKSYGLARNILLGSLFGSELFLRFWRQLFNLFVKLLLFSLGHLLLLRIPHLLG